MTGNEAGQAVPGLQLLPHQAALLEQIAGGAEPKVIVLEGEVGLGKSVALAAACARVIRSEPSARALLLIPSRALGAQFVSLLHTLDVDAALVDRYRFREMLDAAADQFIWPEGRVWVIGWELAGQKDVEETLKSARWRIVVADEAHGAAARRGDLLRAISHAADRMVLSTATLPEHDFEHVLGQAVNHVRWSREEIVATSGLDHPVSLPPTLNTIFYNPSEAERNLERSITAVSTAADPVRSADLVENLKRSRRSGPTALENALRAFLPRGATADLLDDLEEPSEDDPEVDRSSLRRAESQADLAPLVANALTTLEELEGDSKLAAFTAFFEGLHADDAGSRRVCVVTDYVATLFYLAADLEARGKEAFLVHGSMSPEERQKAFEQFDAGRGPLLATRAALKGIEVPGVTDVVFYDVPRTFGGFQGILARFDRIGRKGELRVHVLAAKGEPHPLDESARRALREVDE